MKKMQKCKKCKMHKKYKNEKHLGASYLYKKAKQSKNAKDQKTRGPGRVQTLNLRLGTRFGHYILYIM